MNAQPRRQAPSRDPSMGAIPVAGRVRVVSHELDKAWWAIGVLGLLGTLTVVYGSAHEPSGKPEEA